MTISPSFGSIPKYSANIQKDNKSTDTPQTPSREASWNDVTKHTLVRSEMNLDTLRCFLKNLGVSLTRVLGIKSADDIALDADFNKLVEERSKSVDLEFYEGMLKYSKKIKKAYKRNPELVKDLMLSKVTQEHNCIHNLYDTSDLEYSHSAIALIDEYSQNYPELTDLYKACLSNSYRHNFHCTTEAQERELLDLVTTIPRDIVEKTLHRVGYKDSKYYSYQ